MYESRVVIYNCTALIRLVPDWPVSIAHNSWRAKLWLAQWWTWRLFNRASRVQILPERRQDEMKTFTILRSQLFIFGGYTETDWEGNSYKTDYNSFIYSLKNSFNQSYLHLAIRLSGKTRHWSFALSNFRQLGPSFVVLVSSFYVWYKCNWILSFRLVWIFAP